VPDRLLALRYLFSKRITISATTHNFRSHKSFFNTERHWGSQAKKYPVIESDSSPCSTVDTFPYLTLSGTAVDMGIDYTGADMLASRLEMVSFDAAPTSHLRLFAGRMTVDLPERSDRLPSRRRVPYNRKKFFSALTAIS